MGSFYSKLTSCFSAPDDEYSTIRGIYDLKDLNELPPCRKMGWAAPCQPTHFSDPVRTKTALFMCYNCWTSYRVHSLSTYAPTAPQYEWPHAKIQCPPLNDGLYMRF